jgi:hypothetical protein
MKNNRVIIALTILNVGLVLFQYVRMPAVHAQSEEGILRGKKLQIVDDVGKVRASISVEKPTGRWKDYPETVVFRLIDSNGRPGVKLTTSVVSSTLGLEGRDDPAYAQLIAEGNTSTLKLTNMDGKKSVLTPDK